MFGYTIDWWNVLWWVVSVGVTSLLFELVKYYFVQASDSQISKLFSKWKQTKEQENNSINNFVDIMRRRPDTLNSFTSDYHSNYGVMWTTVVGTFVILGQLFLALSIVNTQFRISLLTGMLVFLLFFALKFFRLHRRNTKVYSEYIKRVKQYAENLENEIRQVREEKEKALQESKHLQEMITFVEPMVKTIEILKEELNQKKSQNTETPTSTDTTP